MKKFALISLLAVSLTSCFDAANVEHTYRTLEPQEEARYKRHGSLAEKLVPKNADTDGRGVVIFDTRNQ